MMEEVFAVNSEAVTATAATIQIQRKQTKSRSYKRSTQRPTTKTCSFIGFLQLLRRLGVSSFRVVHLTTLSSQVISIAILSLVPYPSIHERVTAVFSSAFTSAVLWFYGSERLSTPCHGSGSSQISVDESDELGSAGRGVQGGGERGCSCGTSARAFDGKGQREQDGAIRDAPICWDGREVLIPDYLQQTLSWYTGTVSSLTKTGSKDTYVSVKALFRNVKLKF